MITTINSYVQNKSTDYKALNSKLKNVELTPLELLNNVLKGFAVGIARLIENDDGVYSNYQFFIITFIFHEQIKGVSFISVLPPNATTCHCNFKFLVVDLITIIIH